MINYTLVGKIGSMETQPGSLDKIAILSNKYELRVNRIANRVWGTACVVATTALAISVTITFTVSTVAIATAALVNATVLAILLTGRLIDLATPYLPITLRRLVQVVTGLASEFVFVPFSTILFLFKKTAAKEDRDLKKALVTEHASIAAGNSPTPPSTTRPILLVHGYCFNSSGWYFIKRALKAEGYGPIYTVDLGSPLKTIAHYAQRVEKKAKMIAKRHGRDDITLIGHSMGGLVSTYYQHYLAPPGTVKDNIVCASPVQGSFLAYFAIVASLGLSKAAWNMRPGSAFIKALNQKVKASALPVFCLRSNADPIVIPNRYKIFESHPEDQQKLFEGMGHLQFLFSGRVIDAILARLKALA